MKLKALLTASTLLAGFALFGVNSGAQAAVYDCAGGTPDSNNECNLIITFNSNGSISTTAPSGATSNYDGADDALIGVINDSGHTLNSFNISSTNDIFGFDGDGIDTFISGSNSKDTTGYGGPLGYFTNIHTIGSTEYGTVNFNGGLPTAGGKDLGATYFSLEESVSIEAPPTITGAPEPASMALLGAGLVGLASLRRRRRG